MATSPKFISVQELNKLLKSALTKPGQKRPGPAPNPVANYNIKVVIVRRLNAKTVELGDTTGKVEATIRGIVPPELKVGRGFKIFSLKIEGGILYLTSRSALVPCSTDDWIDLSKVKCEANNIITSQDLLKLENQSHVSSTLFVKVCDVQPIKTAKGGKLKTQRILVADKYHTFFITFFNAAIKEYLPTFQKALDGWVSIEDFTVNFWLGEPGLKLVERTAEILPADENMLKTLSPLPSEIEKAIEETKGIQTEGYFIYINGKSFRRYRKCGNCKGSLGAESDAKCNVRECKVQNYVKTDDGFLVTVVLLDQHGDSVHLRATNEHMNDWLELSGGQKLDQADIDKDNIEEIFKGIQDRVLSITYRVSKKDSTTGGDRENYIMSWEDITEKVVL